MRRAIAVALAVMGMALGGATVAQAAPLPSTAEPSPFSYNGIIRDGQTPLEGVEITVTGNGVDETVATGADGRWSIGVPAAGISGTDGPTLLVEPIEPLGRVGNVVSVEPGLLRALWNGGFVPVVAPLGLGPEGAYNVNADAAAAALAVGLGAGHLFLLTDVDGLLRDGEAVASLDPEESEAFVRSGLAAGGMVPKLRAATEAARGGVRARVLNGNRKGVLAGALSGEDVGTLVYRGGASCRQ